MIIHARVDERLIHGQVAAVWTNLVKADRLYVANDDAWADDMIIGALQLAKPAGKTLTISSVRRAIVNFNHDAFADERVLILTKNIADMKALVEGIEGFDTFNVGNISKQGDAVQIKNSVYLTEKDVEMLKALTSQGTKITAQMVPGESDQPILSFLKES